MYIKQIIVQGFKSYKEHIEMEPFSPGVNVVVGRNGAGKSNFFAAVRFVLSDAYTGMTREERQALLHEGSGSAVVSAFVEIVFDNQDGRFATGNAEVRIRRTISLGKDDYSIDKKASSKADVMSLLEGAGFSKANPYYIVPQGRVTALTNMKEAERLNVLKEIAGTNVYETRRSESMKIMESTDHKRKEIDTAIGTIKDRLAELEGEKEELRAYMEADKEKRNLQYAFYHQQQQNLQAQLNEIDEQRQDDSGDEDRQEFMEMEQAIANVEDKIADLTRIVEALEAERRELDEDHQHRDRAQATAELMLHKLQSTQSARQQTQRLQQEELQRTRKEIRAKDAELAKLAPKWEQLQAQQSELTKQLQLAEHRRDHLLKKQSKTYKSKAERDDCLQREIDDVTSKIGSTKATGIDLQEQLAHQQQRMDALEKSIQVIRQGFADFQAQHDSLKDDLDRAEETRQELEDQMRHFRRKAAAHQSVRKGAEAKLREAEAELGKMMDRSLAKGLESIRRLKEHQDIPGAYGTLAELMTVDVPVYELAVEQVAQGSLFHYLVDNYQTADKLVNYLLHQASGRVTFTPLQQLRPVKPANMPRANDAEPVLAKITYEAKFEAAYQQVFGRWIVCPNIQVASQYARSKQYTLDAVTLEGDIANRNGSMTGGYIERRRNNRLNAVRKLDECRQKHSEEKDRSQHLNHEMARVEKQLTHASGAVRELHERLRKLRDDQLQQQSALARKEDELKRARERCNKTQAAYKTWENNMTELDQELCDLRADLESDFKKSLSANEEHELERLVEHVEELSTALRLVSSKRRELERPKTVVEHELEQNLRPLEAQLSRVEMDDLASGTGNVKDALRALKKTQKAAAEVDKKVQENERQVERARQQVEALEEDKARLAARLAEVASKIKKQQARIERNVQRKALLQTQKDEVDKNLRDITVHSEAFVKYTRLRPEQIQAKLKKVQATLAKLPHVNKKAMEQYESFNKQQMSLLKRRKELDASQRSIEELIAHLDQAKDEAIDRTFKQVSKEFTTVFQRLVPAGHGRLVIQRRADRARNRNAEESDEAEVSGVDNYTGVGISVSFNSKTLDEQQKIQQLSGGQKSLCALCLIFAIQATETSPMVIFDEVDANLDAQYRTAVASLLDSTSKEARSQFICTTFRPEIVHIADKCYGVTFRNKTSKIAGVTREEALGFVEGQQRVSSK